MLHNVDNKYISLLNLYLESILNKQYIGILYEWKLSLWGYSDLQNIADFSNWLKFIIIHYYKILNLKYFMNEFNFLWIKLEILYDITNKWYIFFAGEKLFLRTLQMQVKPVLNCFRAIKSFQKVFYTK